MSRRPPSGRLALIGSYPPRRCGIATFSHDVYRALVEQFPGVDCQVIPVNDQPGYEYPPEVRFEIDELDDASYQRAAEFINFSEAEIVILQHEFGIYGGRAGSHILTLLRDLQVPVVTHLHTILDRFKPAPGRVLDEIIRRSARLIVMSERGRRILERNHAVNPARIDVIPHGIPDMPFVDPSFYKDSFGVEGRKVLLTFGLLNPMKGIEHMIAALPEILRVVPDVVYIVLGATHPGILRHEGESYRLRLERLVHRLNLGEHVIFYNRFVSLPELQTFIGAADVYVTPYLAREQITSGALAYAFGCGKAVVSTPYPHARELLADGRGVLVPYADSAALAREITALLQDEARHNAMRKQAYLLGREMTWANVARRMMASYQRGRFGPVRRRLALRTLGEERPAMPPLVLDHLRRLTDGTGILHHAVHLVPEFAQGYHTVDNALALRLGVLLEETGEAAAVHPLISTYAALVSHALVPATGRFHDRLSFGRAWDFEASDVTLGTVVWALGTCVGRMNLMGLQRWAAQLLGQALPALATATEPRAWALGLLGLQEYFRRFTGDRFAAQVRESLAARLLAEFGRHRRPGWMWCESSVGPAAAQLPQALIRVGRERGLPEMLQTGLQSLRWLMDRRRAPGGEFRAVAGLDDSETRVTAESEQRPTEAAAAVAACLEAYAATGDAAWHEDARRAFEWLLGSNDLGEPLYDVTSGGCRDALLIDRVNLNEGAEATLAFLTARQEMRLVKLAMSSFNQAAEPPAAEAEAETAEAPPELVNEPPPAGAVPPGIKLEERLQAAMPSPRGGRST
ncbi:MAG TPA: glycosyltransferase family 4 protein [Lacunisphaera sp.]|jgi:glycosyltransferase involved in cell wall biosynthesis|nr:glycosyltransferase family 4 protein [Lacunisphaera sp.]